MRNFSLHLDENQRTVRRLSDMKGFYADQEAVAQILKESDPVIYEVYACESEEEGPGNLSYALTVINPGDVGGEYYMTKGHFHHKPSAELYLGLEGEGILLLQDREGNTRRIPLLPGRVSYVPANYAHRSINTGRSQLRFLAIYQSDSGHDYGTIEKEGFRERILVQKN